MEFALDIFLLLVRQSEGLLVLEDKLGRKEALTNRIIASGWSTLRVDQTCRQNEKQGDAEKDAGEFRFHFHIYFSLCKFSLREFSLRKSKDMFRYDSPSFGESYLN